MHAVLKNFGRERGDKNNYYYCCKKGLILNDKSYCFSRLHGRCPRSLDRNCMALSIQKMYIL